MLDTFQERTHYDQAEELQEEKMVLIRVGPGEYLVRLRRGENTLQHHRHRCRTCGRGFELFLDAAKCKLSHISP